MLPILVFAVVATVAAITVSAVLLAYIARVDKARGRELTAIRQARRRSMNRD